MLASSQPVKIPTPWASGASGAYTRAVPIPSQIGINNGYASWTDGFVPLNFQPVGSGGVPPFGQDTNGALNQMSAWLRWAQAGGGIPVYDGTFQTAVGGYPDGAILLSPVTFGLGWISLTDNNTSNPDTGGANWLQWPLVATTTANGLSRQATATEAKTGVTTGSTPAFMTPEDVGVYFVANAPAKLTGNLTIYVATTGNDSTNTGLSVGSPFATLQHAWNVLVSSYNLNGFSATIQLADGTYTGGLFAAASPIGSPAQFPVTVNGHVGSPSAVIISTAGTAITATGPTAFQIQNLTITSSVSNGIVATNGASISFSGLAFGACAANQIAAQYAGSIACSGNYSITGGALAHVSSSLGGQINISGVTVTISGTPAFSNAFAIVSSGTLALNGNTYSGSATGSRYNALLGSWIYTNGAATTYLPGSTSGSTGSGGGYA